MNDSFISICHVFVTLVPLTSSSPPFYQLVSVSASMDTALNAHLFNVMKVGQSEMCPSNSTPGTSEDLLRHCQLQDTLQKNAWPGAVHLTEELYEHPAVLRRTAAFVRGAGVFSPNRVESRKTKKYYSVA